MLPELLTSATVGTVAPRQYLGRSSESCLPYMAASICGSGDGDDLWRCTCLERQGRGSASVFCIIGRSRSLSAKLQKCCSAQTFVVESAVSDSRCDYSYLV